MRGAKRGGMEGGGEAAGCSAKRKREASPDADLCCDICHEVQRRHPCWWRSRSPQGTQAAPCRTLYVCTGLRSPTRGVWERAKRLLWAGGGRPALRCGSGVGGAAWWRLVPSERLYGTCS